MNWGGRNRLCRSRNRLRTRNSLFCSIATGSYCPYRSAASWRSIAIVESSFVR